jgi:hypothetical protein
MSRVLPFLKYLILSDPPPPPLYVSFFSSWVSDSPRILEWTTSAVASFRCLECRSGENIKAAPVAISCLPYLLLKIRTMHKQSAISSMNSSSSINCLLCSIVVTAGATCAVNFHILQRTVSSKVVKFVRRCRQQAKSNRSRASEIITVKLKSHYRR